MAIRARPTPNWCIQLFAHGTYTTVAQVVDIIDFRFRVDKSNRYLMIADDIFLGQYLVIDWRFEVQFAVDLVTANFTQVITLITEE